MVYKHSWLRRLLLPIYGRDQALFSLLMVAVVLGGCLAIEPEALTYVLPGGIIGMWLMSVPHAPVSASAPQSKRAEIVAILDAEWSRAEGTDCWVPPVARWRRWGFVEICVRDHEGAISVAGPMNNVRRLLRAAGVKAARRKRQRSTV